MNARFLDHENLQLRNSFLHKIWPGFKLSLLFSFSSFLFFINRLEITSLSLLLILALYHFTGIPLRYPYEKIRSLFLIFSFIFIFQLFSSDIWTSLIVILRFTDLLLFSELITLTTSVSQMMETLNRFFKILKPFGFQPKKISLTLSLTLRFLPVLKQITYEVSESQKARGLEGNLLTLVIPLIIRTMKMTDNIAEAIEVRCYN
ncbi:MAG: biotin transport system permease protein [Candidatus Tokpelaia sp. JSC161]|jgi:biotin transport system permease protein|nr:MAG: biotin transport system permease protein [Candidatus Tokpelaia sp. JSC161]